MAVVWVHLVAEAALVAAGLLGWKMRCRRPFAAGVLMGLAWQVVLALPAGIWQMVFGWPQVSLAGAGWGRRILMAAGGWPFNAGGLTVRRAFEILQNNVAFFHGSDMALSQAPLWWGLLAIQMGAVAYFAGRRYKRTNRLSDQALLCVLGLVLLNSLLNVRWFWAGT